MVFYPNTDLWESLAAKTKPIVLYGMGNGADKIIRVLNTYGVSVADFFASDGFVRGHQFHGKTVLTYADVRKKYGDGNFVVLVSFATRLPDVMAHIREIASENELYIPDVPVFGNELFTHQFCSDHAAELSATRELLSDERSRDVFDAVIRYRLSGHINDLDTSVCTPTEAMTSILHPENYRITADLGAYTGDTVRELLTFAPNLSKVYTMEPDVRTFRKLTEYAHNETKCHVVPVNACAWNCDDLLHFDASGNRNANINENAKKVIEIPACTPDSIFGDDPIDYIKYDVEGSEYEALEGSLGTLRHCRPELLVSLYHRSSDLFSLPLFLHTIAPDRQLFLRRFPYFPAWDLNLYVT